LMADLPRRVTPFIAGEFRATTSSGTLPKLDPSTGELLADFAVAGEAEVDEAFSAAREANDRWRDRGATGRGEVLLRLAAAIRHDALSLGRIGTLESGVPVATSQAMAQRSADFIDYYAGCAGSIGPSPVAGLPADIGGIAEPEPYGVVGILPSWNGHSGMWRKCAPALAAGNCVVLKPSEQAPFAALHYAALAADAGMPPGVFNVVPGGPTTGQLVAGHAAVGKVSFTGGRRGATAVMATAAQLTRPVLLELGGKSAAIVFADADVDIVGRDVALACMALSGQGCVNPTRLIAECSIMADLLEVIVNVVDALRVGDPASSDTDLGPLISAAARDRVVGQVEACGDNGWGRVVTDQRNTGRAFPSGGFFMRPAVIADVDMGAPIAQEELFGPVLCVTSFETETEAIALANNTSFGLSGYVFSADIHRARRVARAMDVGCVSINRVGPMPAGMPFGGVKGSGFGREGGREGLLEFVQTRVFCETGPGQSIRSGGPAGWLSSGGPGEARS
jgi:aldehyde dehydrogenase (NAD+)